jgi:hypothetical protein
MANLAIPFRRFAVILMLTLGCALLQGAAAQSSSATATPKTATSSSHKSSSTTKSTARKTTPARKSSATTHSASSKRSSRKKKVTRVRGQQKIDSDRARDIQEALIREHYLSGDASGSWNQASEEAMRRYQSDHGWQSKTVPDSRALISLGLGPSNDHLLNPESAMTTRPTTPKAEPLSPTSQSPAPVSSPAMPSTPAQANPSGPQ